MTNDPHERVATLFNRARKLPAGERAAFLAAECGDDAELRAELDSLLEHDLTGAVEAAEAAVASGVRELGLDMAPVQLPEAIGGYRILRQLGAGGMGLVYEAEQSRPQRKVALKVIRPGLASAGLMRRFEHEAEVLGWLDHPGIARIFEAGTADVGTGPQPFFAMELVQGEPIHRHAEQAGLDVAQRLELVARVAEAVHHAHQKGVVHRDLKPANVLVDATGQPKVLDFGVARVTDADLRTTTLMTRAGELVGTLPYMSPEQVGGDPSAVDARSDVYGLGVIAYELLSGQLPRDVSTLSLPEAVRRITEEDATTLSSIDRRFRGDVDVIVSKALATEKERRYGSAEELAQDIRRHLADEPIHARPPSGAYNLAKFARRNRALVAGVALAFAALLIGAVVSTAQYLDARAGWNAERAQRELAEENALAADQVSEFLVDLFQVPGGRQVGPDGDWGASITARELLDRGAANIASGLAEQPRTRARLMRTMGRVYGNLGLFDDARPLLEEALALARDGGDPELIAASLFRLASLEREAGNYGPAEAGMREALELLSAADLGDTQLYADAVGGLAGVQVLRGELDEGERSARRALALTAALHGEDSAEASFPLATLTYVHNERDEWDAARASAERVLELRRAHLSPGHPDVVDAMTLLGMIHFEQGDAAAALASAREVYAIQVERLDENHPGRIDAMHALAIALEDYGEPLEAEALLVEVVERTAELYGEGNPRHADSLHALGGLQNTLATYAESEANLRAALAIRERTLGPDHLHVASTLNVLGTMLTLGPRRAEEAIPLIERALEIAEAQLGGPERATVATYMGTLANAQGYAGRYQDAYETHDRLLELYRELRGPAHPDVARTLHNLSMIAMSLEDYTGGLAYAEECYEVHEALLPPGHPDRAFNLVALGRCYYELGDFADAEEAFARSLEIREESLPAGHMHTAESKALLAMSLSQREAYAEAEPLLMDALAICEANFPEDHPQMGFMLARIQNLYRAWGKPEEADRWLERRDAAGH